MGWRRATQDPGTAEAAPNYCPFRLQQLDGKWFQVLMGELWVNHVEHEALASIEGLMLPFKINHKSYVYLAVYLDMSGAVTFAEICHTGTHVCGPGKPFLPGEKWQNWPKPFSVDLMPYYGAENYHESGGRRLYGGTGKGNPSKTWPRAHTHGWFGGDIRRERTIGGIGSNKTTAQFDHKTYNYFYGGPRTTSTYDPDAYRSTAGWSADGRTRAIAYGQVYLGLNRELRKGICAQKDVGRIASRTYHPPPYNEERQRMGRKGERQTRGYYEIGGSRYPDVPNNTTQGGSNAHLNIHAGWHSQAREFTELLEHISINTFNTRGTTSKYKKTKSDQVACYFPIAYATLDTHEIGGHYGGVRFPADKKSPTGGGEPAFQIKQACRTHLQLSSIWDGDDQKKIILPYQGMDSGIQNRSESIGSVTKLNFEQRYPYYNRALVANSAWFPYPALYMRKIFGFQAVNYALIEPSTRGNNPRVKRIEDPPGSGTWRDAVASDVIELLQ